jgi:hypothetical protein
VKRDIALRRAGILARTNMVRSARLIVKKYIPAGQVIPAIESHRVPPTGMPNTAPVVYRVFAKRLDSHDGARRCQDGGIPFWTDLSITDRDSAISGGVKYALDNDTSYAPRAKIAQMLIDAISEAMPLSGSFWLSVRIQVEE